MRTPWLKELSDENSRCDIGLIRFAGVAERVPVRREHPCQTTTLVTGIRQENIPEGTAIGEAIFLSSKSFLSSATSKKLVIISDGDNTAGNVSVERACELAKRSHIKIFTIGIGTTRRVRFGTDKTGAPTYVENTFSDVSMKIIAESTGGTYTLVHTNEELTGILTKIFSEAR